MEIEILQAILSQLELLNAMIYLSITSLSALIFMTFIIYLITRFVK